MVERSPLNEAMDCGGISTYTVLEVEALYLQEARPGALGLGRHSGAFFFSHGDRCGSKKLYRRKGMQVEVVATEWGSGVSALLEYPKAGRSGLLLWRRRRVCEIGNDVAPLR
jgi:hypothetical protein